MRRLLILLLFVAVPVLVADETPAPPAPTPAPGPGNAGRTQLFQVVLVRGAISGPEELVGIPKNAEKAIRDIRDFLPFKSYKVLDSGLMRVEQLETREGLGKIRLDGLSPQQYDIRVVWTDGSKGKISIWEFAVFPVRSSEGRTLLPRGVAPEAEKPIISTSFSVDVGETIVVGSSKIGGDQALIVLFTVIPNR